MTDQELFNKVVTYLAIQDRQSVIPRRTMTQQEIFDTVVIHLAEQGLPAVDAGQCKYRFGNLKCAVGWLIPDSLYERRMEDLTLLKVYEILLNENIVGRGDYELLFQLQFAHDSSNGIDRLRSAFMQIAEHFHLNSDAVSKVTKWEDLWQS